MRTRLTIALVGLLATWVGSASAQSAQPWVENRAIGEGAGVKVGDFELHPGISGEFGYDTNYFQRSSSSVDQLAFGPPADSLRLRVTPQLSLRTMDRRLDLAEDERDVLPPPISFELQGAAQYNEFIALDSAFSDSFSAQRNIQGGGGFDIGILPQRKWSGNVGASYNFIAEPSNVGGLTQQFSRHVIGVDAGLKWSPGGGAFDWTLVRYMSRFTLFQENQFEIYDNANHRLLTQGRWKFLPKTALLYEGQVGIIRYGRETLNDGENLKASLGVNGLLTKRLSLLVSGGWAASMYANQNGLARNYDDFIAHTEARWFLTSGNEKLKEGSANVGASSLAAGYVRSFQDGYLGDFFQSDRGYAQFMYLINGNIVTTLEGGFSHINYPDFLLGGVPQEGFSENRVDLKAFVEYRPLQTLGIHLLLRYDEAFSQIISGDSINDDLSFSRFRAFLGARWFL